MSTARPHQGLVEFGLSFGGSPQHQATSRLKIDVRRVNFWYGAKQALRDVSLSLYDREVTAFMGPSGCGKTTLLRSLNRSHDGISGVRMEGQVLLDGRDVNDPAIDPPFLRRRFGWVAQKPNPFPWSIRENIAYGPRLHGLVQGRAETDHLVETCLRRVGMWEEVRDRLAQSGTDLSGGQQQRLCIARAIAIRPEVLLMDEPCSSLDPGSTGIVEDLIADLRQQFAVVIITHNLQQAARVAQRVAMFHLGTLVESGDAEQVLTDPARDVTRAYLEGAFG